MEQANTVVEELWQRKFICVTSKAIDHRRDEERTFTKRIGLDCAEPFDPMRFQFERALFITDKQSWGKVILLLQSQPRTIERETAKVRTIWNIHEFILRNRCRERALVGSTGVAPRSEHTGAGAPLPG